MKDSTDEPSYCKQVIDRDFEVVEGQIKINLREFTNCNNDYQDLDGRSLQCVDWEDIEMAISLNLNECHENINITRKSTKIFLDTYKSTCKENKEKCDWIGDEKEKGKLCLKKNVTDLNSFTNTPFKKLQSLKATKFTGTISMGEEEGTKMIFLNDSRGNLECLKKNYEIQSLGKK